MENRPIQIVHSFEGLVNGLDAIEVMPRFGRPRPYDLNDFEERLSEEMRKLAATGVGGIAVNVGYDGYLESEEGWNRFLTGLEMAVDLGLRIWIYDENGYPSGSAGGLAVADRPDLQALGIKLMRTGEVSAPRTIPLPDPRAQVLAVYGISADGKVIPLTSKRDAVSLAGEGDGAPMVTISEGRFRDVEIYFTATLFDGSHADYFDTSRQPYMNVLDGRAVNRFLSVTHMRYFKRIPPHLWRHVQAVFTDEPSIMSHTLCPMPGQVYYPSVCWSQDFSQVFFSRKGYLMEERIRSLFGGTEESDRRARRDYWDVAAEMYEQAFAVQSSRICSAIGVALSGHLLAEETLWQEMAVQANPLSVLKHFQIPGIDILTCEPGFFNRSYLMTLKLGISAALLGGKRDLMVEVSEYSEYWNEERRKKLPETPAYWEVPRNANPLEHLEYTLAFLFLAGVREYCFYFPWRAFSQDEYRRLCALVETMNALGRGAAYKPACALYYPIETMWEEYIPKEKEIWTTALDAQSDRLKRLDYTMSRTCKSLLYANAQYILADRKHLSRLLELGIRTLVFLPGESPERQVADFCAAHGMDIVQLPDADLKELPESLRPSLRVDEGIVYHTYDGFTFLVNTTAQPLSFSAGDADVVFPTQGTARRRVSGNTTLPAYGCAFLFPSE